MNRTIKLLMFSDIFTLTGFGLIEPILAIFINDRIVGGTIVAAGLASMLFLITKSLVQLPFSRYVDSHDFKVRWLIIGSFLIALVPFIYLSARSIGSVYVAQVVYGIGSGLAYPTWLGLWSTHLDRKHESFEWSLYSTATGLGTAGSAVVGAEIAQLFGFAWTFALVGAMALAGALVLLRLEQRKEKQKIIPARHYHRHRKLGYRHR